MTPNRLIMSVAPAESTTVPRRSSSGHRPADITAATYGSHYGAIQQRKQRLAWVQPRSIADFSPARFWQVGHCDGSNKPLDRMNHN